VGQVTLFDNFTTPPDIRFRTEFLSPAEIAEGKDPADYGKFEVVHGQGVLSAFQKNVRGTYYSGPVGLDFERGFTLACQCQRVQLNGGMTEFEIGVHEFGPFWHFEWTHQYLDFYLVRFDWAPMKLQQRVWFHTQSPRLALQAIATPNGRSIITTAVDRDNERMLIHREDDLAWDTFDHVRDRMHFNFVATANQHTTKEQPLTLAIDHVYLGPMLPHQQAHRIVNAFGWMVVGAS
jgi:hypothetical protein